MRQALAALIRLDHSLFHLINQSWTLPWLDRAMPVLTEYHHSALFRFALLPLGVAGWLYARRGAGLKVLLGLVVVVGLSDVAAFRVVKPLAHRPRPQFDGVHAVVLAPERGAYGFPSNHAANCFAMASFLGSLYPAAAAFLYAFAALIAYSRVYVGVHFPADVAAGALLGLAIGWAGSLVFRKLVPPPRT